MTHYQLIFEGRRATLEVLNWGQHREGWRVGIQLALDNRLAIPFDVGIADWYKEQERGEAALLQFLCRQASILLEQFGDAREGRPIVAQLEA